MTNETLKLALDELGSCHDDYNYLLGITENKNNLHGWLRMRLARVAKIRYDLDAEQAKGREAVAYKDSTPDLHVGDSAFESWHQEYNPAHKSDKQRARDAYAAGMGDPLVTYITPPAQPACEWVDPDEALIQYLYGKHSRYQEEGMEISGWGNFARELNAALREKNAGQPVVKEN